MARALREGAGCGCAGSARVTRERRRDEVPARRSGRYRRGTILIGSGPLTHLGRRLFVRVVPVLFSTALISSFSARSQKFPFAARSTSTPLLSRACVRTASSEALAAGRRIRAAAPQTWPALRGGPSQGSRR